jgi:protein involved in ribonucleotide reduction
MIKNKKSMSIIFLTVLFTLFIIAGLSTISMSSEAPTGKEIKEEKQITPDNKEQKIKSVPKLGKEVKDQKNPYANAEITINIIASANKTFGYDILLSGKPLVHQPHIPGLPGNDGFTTKERAQTVAEFVVKKIKNNEMPPTVTIEDLNKMGVLK